jgi:hypothetical protein
MSQNIQEYVARRIYELATDKHKAHMWIVLNERIPVCVCETEEKAKRIANMYNNASNNIHQKKSIFSPFGRMSYVPEHIPRPINFYEWAKIPKF